MPKPDLSITRVSMPDWVLRPITTAGPDELGGPLEWHFATPWLFRALASPETYEPILAAPGPQDPHEQRRAYWACVLYLMLYRLGWADPGRGLAWWAAAGYPDDDDNDRTLSLIKKSGSTTDASHCCVLGSTASPGRSCPSSSPGAGTHPHPPVPLRPASASDTDGESIYDKPLGPAQLHLDSGGHLRGPTSRI